MSYEQSYRKLISGQKAGPAAAVQRVFLCIISIFYSIAVRFRNFLYSSGLLKTHQVNADVISIGNITVGGTGKTPLVIWLCKKLHNLKSQAPKYNCAILTRGYKAQVQQQDTTIDEVAMLTQSCSETKVVVNPDRISGAVEAIEKYGAQILILDDGFQHRRIARDLDIIAIDATGPFGYGRIFPAGLLREPVSSLRRADTVVITRSDQITSTELEQLETKLKQINPDMVITRSIHAPVYIQTSDNKKMELEQLKGKKVFAFCGIGNPEAFMTTITSLGAELAGSKVYDDHYLYTNKCLAEIYKQAENLKADLILTTMKDWTKVTPLLQPDSKIPLAYLEIEIKFTSGEDKLTDLIEQTLGSTISKSS